MVSWQKCDDTLGRIEKFTLTVMLSVMILLAFIQIVLRNVFSSGIAWGDPLVRYLVLWVGFVGASLATREGKHITIEVFSRWLSVRGNRYLRVISNLISALVCALLVFAGWTFVSNEAQMGDTTFLQIPIWIPQIIIPVAFAMMTLRFFVRFFAELVMLVNSGKHIEHGNAS
ncbi:MAG: TRAP transporter small permease [Deltaproteobacteria bacterium]|jgi:TRAP-type C4-dicarboxylate transport system permease small subunit|nr:TRAP transporter small permease [Deltaproteobacteria bacterium]